MRSMKGYGLRLCVFASILPAVCLLTPLLAVAEELAEGLPNGEANYQGAKEAAVEVVVTASRMETALRETASSVTVIEAKEAERRGQISVADSLCMVPSVDVVSSGAAGGNTAVFMRGANSEHTLVLIDGVEANSPINPSRSYNFADLRFDNVERVEVLRGPQSTLYGSDALGGVINIITKKGEGPAAGYISSEAGSYRTFVQRAGVSGGGGGHHYALGVLREDTAGISAAGARYGNSEHDGYGNTSLSSRFGINAGELAEAQVFLRYIDARSELDNFGGAGGDDPNRKAVNQQLFTRGEIKFNLAGKSWQPIFSISYSDQQFKDDNDPDVFHPDEIMRSKYSGAMRKLDWQNNIDLSEWFKLVLGAENQEESGESRFSSDGPFGPFSSDFDKRSATTNGFYAQAQSEMFERLYLTAGVRLDDHSKFGSQTTWRAGPAFLIEETGTKLSFTAGTGYKAPSLFQLYSSYGSQDLKAEESLGIDAGIEQDIWGERARLGVTYFHNDFDQLITFDPDTFMYSNIAKASSQGIETYVRLKAADWCRLGFNYTYTDTEDKETGLALLRRPRNKLGAEINLDLSDKLHLNVNAIFAGKRYDNDYSAFPAARASLGGYGLLNAAVAYDLTPSVQMFARVDNIFDKEYEDVLGYGTLGAAAYGGVRVKL